MVVPMESQSTISKLNKYKSLIKPEDLDDLIDFLYSKKIIDEKDYGAIYQCKGKSLRLHAIFKLVELKHNEVEKVVKYLNEAFPNSERQVLDEQNFRKCSVRGGFPKLPPNYVTRSELVEDVKSKLLGLQWNQKLVIHGLMGYGKSCLINEVLNDITVRKYFDNNIFWINLGKHHSDESVFETLWRLYLTASSIIQNKTAPCPDDVNKVKDLLINLFLQPRLENALIILDDACSNKVLMHFDIKCKTVITTQNRKILCQEEGIFVEVKTGFARRESLELFRKSLDLNPESKLPAIAEEIHRICKGHPMLISHIGSFLKDNAKDARNKNDIWEYMKVTFLRGSYTLNEYDNQDAIPTKKIEKCVSQILANGLKEYYHDLAIFMSDVNVPPEVLQILWNKSRMEVQNIMNKFAEKSLVVPFYHTDLKTYIYGIHDIHLSYLKDVTRSRIISLHKKLISGYDRVTNGNYASLPNDNYTLQYIGYHLYKAEDFNKFNIYFDLKFLEAKIKAVGKQDVLRDMKKYEDYITNNDNILKEKLDQYREFVNRCGCNIYNYEKTDIIQFALGEQKDSIVYKEGLKSSKKSDKLYFQLQRPVDEYDHSTINVRDDITSACYVDSPNHILIGTTSGKIKLFFEESEKDISIFVGHTSGITKLVVSPDKRYFLSVSTDRSVMLWKFTADSSRNSFDFSESNLPVSPKTKQKYWLDMFTSDRGQIKPRRTFQLEEEDDFLMTAAFCDQFPEVFRIVTGSSRGNAIIWDGESGQQLRETGPRGYNISSIIYIKSETDDRVIFSCEDSIHIYTFNERIHYTTLHSNDYFRSIYFADNRIIAVSDKSITLWKQYKLDKRILQIQETEMYHTCSTLTDDSHYLVVSTNLNTVYVWDFDEEKIVKKFKSKGLTMSLDTFYDEDKSVHVLLIGSDQQTLQQCHILPDDKEQKIAQDFKFFPYWKKKRALTALVNNDNQIQIFNGSVQISETNLLEPKVTCTCFSACGQNVIYGTANGQVHVFNIHHKRTLCIETNNANKYTSVTHLYCYNPNVNRSCSISSTGSGDSLDLDISFEGVIVSVFGNKDVWVHYENKIICRQANSPVIFFSSHNLVLVDKDCEISIWDLKADTVATLKKPDVPGTVALLTATYCNEKKLIGTAFKQDNKYFLHIYSTADDTELQKQEKLDGEATSSCFSCDGALLAIGMRSGDIMVWNLTQRFKTTKLSLHTSPVDNLLFSPSMEPILVSQGEYVAWWNLKRFQETPQKGGKPKSIGILDSICKDVSSMDLSFWGNRQYIKNIEYLLACINLHGRPRCLSASKDFNSFLTVDEKGKIYVMDIVTNSSD